MGLCREDLLSTASTREFVGCKGVPKLLMRSSKAPHIMTAVVFEMTIATDRPAYFIHWNLYAACLTVIILLLAATLDKRDHAKTFLNAAE
jgi:hypothetical protein